MFIRRNNIKQTLLTTTFFLFLLSLLFRLINQIFSTYGVESWQLSEFLINYQGGFVRRGLTGELLFFFYENFKINIEWTVKIICLISFLAVCFFFIKAFIKKDYSLYILPLCFFLGMGILTNYWIRKDYLMLYFLISILRLYESNLSIVIKIGMINILLIFILLTHEVFAFFSLPALFFLFLYQYKSRGDLKASILSFISLSPAISCFFLTLLHHGTSETAQAIWHSWQVIAKNQFSNINIENVPAVGSIGWASESAAKFHFSLNFLTIDKEIFSSVVWFISFPVVYYIATNALFVFRKAENSFTSEHKKLLSLILIFQFLCLLPVFVILSCDYSRLFFYWISSSFAIFLIFPSDKLEKLVPSFFTKFINNLNNCFSSIMLPTKTTIILLMLFFGISNYKFDINEVIGNSMIYNVLLVVSKPLVILKYILIGKF